MQPSLFQNENSRKLRAAVPMSYSALSIEGFLASTSEKRRGLGLISAGVFTRLGEGLIFLTLIGVRVRASANGVIGFWSCVVRLAIGGGNSRSISSVSLRGLPAFDCSDGPVRKRYESQESLSIM